MSREQRPVRRPPGRTRACLVLAVLAGLLGLHGLAAAPASTALAPPHSSASSGERPAGPRLSADGACHDPCGGHETHAVTDCAAASVSTGPAPSPLSPARYAVRGAAGTPATAGPPAPRGGRGPPSLSELQLLRI
ncbi:DUF6153 family protein [Streptomyces sp. S07_1.15]|uniref:DUF6153 family protein n=1 Tax=Streptomyces sp. S07_1.15 TaxID=2873925 RepID=UPI001D1348AF|nr:DUF6153 family protein [Streptomyces sp. S07_1.15]MCC3649971.1 DUF6153 family protein [Streptomyces sp. S07_1.15]